jgi:hypothetical protein
VLVNHVVRKADDPDVIVNDSLVNNSFINQIRLSCTAQMPSAFDSNTYTIKLGITNLHEPLSVHEIM